MPTYTYATYKSRVNAGIKGKIGMLVNDRETLNEAARSVVSDIDLRSTKRKSTLSPSLFSDIFQYAAPTDLKGLAIIDIDPQTDRRHSDYTLVPFESFMRRQDPRTIALQDNDMIRKILINASIYGNESITISSFDSLSAGGGSWIAFGDATNIDADTHNFIKENGSLSWDISAVGGTTAGLQNTTLNDFDVSDYLGGNGAVFVWVYITSTTNLTNFIIRVGSSSTDYYSKTITAASDGTAFRNGWNLLRFDLSSLSTTGTPENDSCDFVAIYMTKTAGKINETGYRFDSLMIRKGEIHEVVYYSKYAWQNSSGTYLENSTDDNDYLNADTDEFELMIAKGIELGGLEVDEIDASDRAAKRYKEKKAEYVLKNPSDAKLIIDNYADFISTY